MIWEKLYIVSIFLQSLFQPFFSGFILQMYKNCQILLHGSYSSSMILLPTTLFSYRFPPDYSLLFSTFLTNLLISWFNIIAAIKISPSAASCHTEFTLAICRPEFSIVIMTTPIRTPPDGLCLLLRRFRRVRLL